jgi:hypothetical protein
MSRLRLDRPASYFALRYARRNALGSSGFKDWLQWFDKQGMPSSETDVATLHSPSELGDAVVNNGLGIDRSLETLAVCEEHEPPSRIRRVCVSGRVRLTVSQRSER